MIVNWLKKKLFLAQALAHLEDRPAVLIDFNSGLEEQAEALHRILYNELMVGAKVFNRREDFVSFAQSHEGFPPNLIEETFLLVQVIQMNQQILDLSEDDVRNVSKMSLLGTPHMLSVVSKISIANGVRLSGSINNDTGFSSLDGVMIQNVEENHSDSNPTPVITSINLASQKALAGMLQIDWLKFRELSKSRLTPTQKKLNQEELDLEIAIALVKNYSEILCLTDLTDEALSRYISVDSQKFETTPFSKIAVVCHDRGVRVTGEYSKDKGLTQSLKSALKVTNIYHHKAPCSALTHGMSTLEVGCLYFERELFDNAVDAFEEATAIAPAYDIGWYWLAKSYEQQGKIGEAVNAIQVALQLEPTKATYLSMLSSLTGAG